MGFLSDICKLRYIDSYFTLLFYYAHNKNCFAAKDKGREAAHQMLTSSHNLSSFFYSVWSFPLWGSQSLEKINGFLQIFFTACYFSTQTSSSSSCACLNLEAKRWAATLRLSVTSSDPSAAVLCPPDAL